MIKSYKDLNVWQKAIQLANAIYKCTAKFPKEEVYGLTSQMRRCVVSVASNIAEGSVRGRKEFIQFLSIARGSLAELETQLIIAQNQRFVVDKDSTMLQAEMALLSKMLMGLQRSLEELPHKAQGTKHKALAE